MDELAAGLSYARVEAIVSRALHYALSDRSANDVIASWILRFIAAAAKDAPMDMSARLEALATRPTPIGALSFEVPGFRDWPPGFERRRSAAIERSTRAALRIVHFFVQQQLEYWDAQRHRDEVVRMIAGDLPQLLADPSDMAAFLGAQLRVACELGAAIGMGDEEIGDRFDASDARYTRQYNAREANTRANDD